MVDAMGRPSWTELWSGMASQVSRRATCSRLQVGAILVSPDNVLLGMGYNGSPRGIPHCVHDGTEQHCTMAVHAEVNAIASAARKGHAVEQATCYVTTAPCLYCAGVLINAGIKEVVYNSTYSRNDGLYLLVQADVPVRKH